MSASGHAHRNSVQSAINSPAQARGSGHGSIDEPGDTLNSEHGDAEQDPGNQLNEEDLNQIEKFLEQDGQRNSQVASQQ
jgi:LSD1 subclass zinc finger protein